MKDAPSLAHTRCFVAVTATSHLLLLLLLLLQLDTDSIAAVLSSSSAVALFPALLQSHDVDTRALTQYLSR